MLDETVVVHDFVEFHLTEPEQLCGGTLRYLDDYAGWLFRQHDPNADSIESAIPAEPVPYYWLADDRDRLTDACDGGLACVLEGAVVTERIPHEHELVHGVRIRFGRANLALEEGAAELWGDVHDRENSTLLPIEEAFEASTGPGSLGIQYYPAVGHFSAFLEAEFGTEALVDVSRRALRDSDLPAISQAFVDSFGITLEDAQVSFDDWRRDCGRSLYRDDRPSCESAVPLDCTSADENGDVTVELELGCGSDGVVGTWETPARIELSFMPERNKEIYISGEWPSDQAEVVFGECVPGCEDRHSMRTPGSEVDDIVRAGRQYFIRVSMPRAIASGTARLHLRNLCEQE